MPAQGSHAHAAPVPSARPRRTADPIYSRPARAFHPLERLEREAERTASRILDSHFKGRGTGRAASKDTSSASDRLTADELVFFSRRLGHDFSQVRIHADARADRLCDEADADGLTRGGEVFLPGDVSSDPDERLEVLAHELAHVLQQRGKSEREEVAQTQPRQRRDGIGRAPPRDEFETVEGVAEEDGFVLFPHDSARLELLDAEQIQMLFASPEGPVTVELHGYASLEGDSDYNLNLSAHRAAALKRYLKRRLHPDSEIRLYAHGETHEFGEEPSDNRRVGIRIISEAAPEASETAPQSSQGAVPGATAVPSPDVSLFPPLSSLFTEPFTTTPPPWLTLQPPYSPFSEFRPNYFDLMSGAWSHLQAPSERDFESVMALARQNYQFFRSIIGSGSLPLLGDASDLANLTAAYAYSNQMALEFPTMFERANRDWEIQMRMQDPDFWQTPMITKTWYWSFPWEDVPSEEERRRSHDER